MNPFRSFFRGFHSGSLLRSELKSIQQLSEDGLVNPTIIDGLKRLGFKNLTLVQSKTIEPILTTEDDVVTKAKTGTGKTLAFGIPLMEQVLKNPKSNPKVRSLIIAPTRDLAFQIRDELNKLSNLKEVQKASFNRLKVSTAVGGESRWAQIREITNKRFCPSIVVATPGRFLDLIREPDVSHAFENIESVVLDEADRLLGEGFKEDLVEITDILKENRENSTLTNLPSLKTLLFSATLDKPIIEFSKRILKENFHFIDTVDPNEPETHEKINQSLILTNNVFESYAAAISFIQNESKNNRNFKSIIFLPTVKGVSYFYEILNNYLRENNHGLRSHQLHGQLRQPVRDRAVKNFRNSFSGILVASDVGARGMDFPNVSNVIQIGLPMDATNYVHRVGRTARGGNSGKAVMILSKSESRFIRVLKNRNITVSEQFEYQPDEKVETQIPEISKRVPHKFSLEMVIESLAGFSKSVSNNYRLNMYEVLDDIKETYARFMEDENAKPKVTMTYANKVLGLNRRSATEFFDIQSTRPQENDQDNDDQYIKPRNNRSNYNDRNYSNDRNSNDRRYSNDRNDRRSNEKFNRFGSQNRSERGRTNKRF